MKVVRALVIDTFMYDEVLTILFRNKDAGTVGAAKFGGFGKTVILSGREMCLTDFAPNLGLLLSVVP